MKQDEMYSEIVKTYLGNGSIGDTSELLGVSHVKVMRTLITEGLWSSDASEKVAKLLERGLTRDEMAEELAISRKAVEAYLPYRRGAYSETPSTRDAARCRLYRERNRSAAQSSPASARMTEEEPLIPYENRKRERFTVQENRQVSLAGSIAASARRRKAECLYRLNLELVEKDASEEGFSGFELTEEERAILLRRGKSFGVPSREIIVPGDMNLHALHFCIQRLFGWRNAHLHGFGIPADAFMAVTGGTLGGWEQLCGVLFRFPEADFPDLFWDDDYDGSRSAASWMKSRYTGRRRDLCAGDTCIDCRRSLAGLRDSLARDGITLNADQGISPWEFPVAVDLDSNTLRESLRIADLLMESGTDYGKWLMEEKGLINENEERAEETRHDGIYARAEEGLSELHGLRRAKAAVEGGMYDRKGFPGKPQMYLARYGKDIEELVRSIWDVVEYTDPEVIPGFRSLIYSYDPGDGWCVRITCREVIGRGSELFDISALEEGIPRCTMVNGTRLMDDVGGFRGYIDFLGALEGDDEDERERMLAWAKCMGWTGRNVSPARML